MRLEDEVRYIKGIGEARARALTKLGVRTLRDLIEFFPRRHEDRTAISRIADLRPGESACVSAVVADTPVKSRVKSGLVLVKFRIADETGSMDMTFFNQEYIKDKVVRGGEYIFFGKVGGAHPRLSMTNPEFEPAGSGEKTLRILPVYPLTSGISQNVMRTTVRRGLDMCGSFPDYLPETVRHRESLAESVFSYENIHFPGNNAALHQARERLIFEEFFVLTCAFALLRSRKKESAGIRLKETNFDEFFSALPFELTNAQKRSIGECAGDMCSDSPMNRILQGDVGSGKTMVAGACAWMAFKNGAQAAVMAPTEILARQHLNTFTSLLEPLGVKVGLLIGSMTQKVKRQVLEGAANGEIDILVGTHALLTGSVAFKNLALVITDEQHRFGVMQRSALTGKGESPHVLVMSATPIPRTLALVIYGDLDLSVLDEMPPGRKAVKTYAVGENMRGRINSFIEKTASGGRQVFVVCPKVEEDEDGEETELKSADGHAGELTELFPDLRIACVHGRMKSSEKEAVMDSFVEGETQVLVSTTVVEVGVDVPNAALMVVENADRFGLSQLHQLRGRVGRGVHESYCVLISNNRGEDARFRLKTMCDTNDGFKIAEADLSLRGPGDFFGQRQHGLPEMKIADLCGDLELLLRAQRAAKEVIAADPGLSNPENLQLKERISGYFRLGGDVLN